MDWVWGPPLLLNQVTGFLIKALWESVLSNGNEGDDLSLVIMRVIVSC